MIGSDGRTSAADCKLGGGCSQTGVQSGNGNADVEMVVHIAADRSNATVMSVPRDTMANVPACSDPASKQSTPGYYGQINSALSYGPACQVATIHQLTDIPIDHFFKLDFSGVVSMSDAVGGVDVCVSDNVYDTYSHLKLSKGTHTLKGVGALEFVRSRHGFGDGSDLGRTVSQHLFLGAMIRKFKSAEHADRPHQGLRPRRRGHQGAHRRRRPRQHQQTGRPRLRPEQGPLPPDHLHHHADRPGPQQQGPRRTGRRSEVAVREHRQRPVADHRFG
ncbi:LCP family protein [Streptomyces lasalocidi]